MTLDHGGNLDAAIACYGGRAEDWLDLSTGINPQPWPVPELPAAAWTRLPTAGAAARLEAAARDCYQVPDEAAIAAAPGASALIRLAPRLGPPREVSIPGPTYNEHAAAFAAEGWRVVDRPGPATTAAVLVNPNNPDGRRWTPAELAMLADALPLLIVDESFADAFPELSLMGETGREGLVVLRSFGKFWGLAGLRLGFAIAAPRETRRLTEMLGPWPVSGPALEIGAQALADAEWAEVTRIRLRRDAERLTGLAARAGWRPVGGADLFTTFDTPDAGEAQGRLASHRIWSRRFPYSDRWLRLGLPGDAAGWGRLEAALG